MYPCDKINGCSSRVGLPNKYLDSYVGKIGSAMRASLEIVFCRLGGVASDINLGGCRRS